jgi:hypothetical protein
MALKEFSDKKKEELVKWFHKVSGKYIEPIGVNEWDDGYGFVFIFRKKELETIIFTKDFSAILKQVAYNLKNNLYDV